MLCVFSVDPLDLHDACFSYLTAATEGRKGLFGLQFQGLQFTVMGRHGSKNTRQLVTLYPQRGSRECTGIVARHETSVSALL